MDNVTASGLSYDDHKLGKEVESTTNVQSVRQERDYGEKSIRQMGHVNETIVAYP